MELGLVIIRRMDGKISVVILRLEREGLHWYAYIAMVDPVTGVHNYMLGSKRNIHFEDKNMDYTAPISQIQVAFRMFLEVKKSRCIFTI